MAGNDNRGFYVKLSPGMYTYSQCAVNTDVQIALFKSIPEAGMSTNIDKRFNINVAVKSDITVEEDAPYLFVKYTHVVSETTLSEEEVRNSIMINAGSTALPYEPYKPAQNLIIPTPGCLPGIPVSSGGNYTDEKGQQWVADEIDLARGERVQRIEKLDLKSLLWSKQSRASNASGFWFSSRIKSASLFGANVKGTISNIGRLGNPYNMIGDYVWALTNAGNSEIRIGFADSTIDSLEKLTNLLNSLPEAYAMYCLAEPIRTPLPPETIAAYKKLHTYSPTTTVINDAGAGMSVGYKRK